MTGSGSTTTAPFTSYIADTLKFTGNGSLTVNSDPTQTRLPIPVAILGGTKGVTRLIK